MGFLENVQGGFNRGVASASRTSKKVQTNLQINDARRRVDSLYLQLGKVLYEQTKDDGEFRLGHENLYLSIEDAHSTIGLLQTDLQQLELERHVAAASSPSFLPAFPSRSSSASMQGITCPNCGSLAQADGTFCISCGADIASASQSCITCEQCGASLLPDALFCMACGYSVNSVDAPADGTVQAVVEETR
jgi:hypothetical protein